MVLSEIDRRVEYEEDSSIDSRDNELESLIYPIEISYDENNRSQYNKFKIAFGRENREYTKTNDIIYYPIYLVVADEVKSKIGILEVEKDLQKTIVDENGDIDSDKMPEPLLFSFVTDDYLTGFKTGLTVESPEESEELEESDEEPKPKTDHDNLFDLDEESIKKRGKHVVDETDDNNDSSIPETPKKPESIFKKDINTKMPVTLTEETKKDAETLRTEYTESTRSEWIEKFMKNNQYKIIDNEGDGDCLFAVIRDAYKQIGQHTTVDILRQVLAEEATDELFQEYRGIYLSMENSILQNEDEIKKNTNQLKVYKRRILDKSTDRAESQQLLSDAKTIQKQIETLKQENRENSEFLRYNFGFMKNINTLDSLKKFIQTSSYWADSWAISTLEEKLNFKFVIFSEESFDENSLDSVLQCGDYSNNLKRLGKFTPNFYVMTSYNGLHYRLITYKDKRILDFRELPYDIKMLIINKCMEHNSGVFDLIPDFRNLKAKIGLSTDGESSDDDTAADEYMTALFDKDIVFVLGANAPIKKYPGTSENGEHIPNEKKSNFIRLSKIDAWRRKLHDSWTDAPFSLDGHRWASVEHYYQGSKFKKGFPDFYVRFSLDYPSELSEKVDVAKQAGSKNGQKHREKKFAKVTIDPDFYGGRNLEERAKAIEAKIEQNEDLKQILLMTAPAKLVDFVRRSKSEINEPLMSIRKKFAES